MAILNIALRHAADTYKDRPAVGAPVPVETLRDAGATPRKPAPAQHPAMDPDRERVTGTPAPQGHPRSRRTEPQVRVSTPQLSPVAVEADTEWRLYVECGPGDTELFFSKDPMEKRAALAICTDCPVARECLAEAMAQEKGVDLHGRYGIRGGTTPVQRRELSRAMNQRPATPRRKTPTSKAG